MASITSPEHVLHHRQGGERGNGEETRYRPGGNVVHDKPDRDSGQDREADAKMEPETVSFRGGDRRLDTGRRFSQPVSCPR
jgi:hypothetical protein